MYKAKVKLVYKQVIDEASPSGFEKAIFHASYQEFLLKSQAYNRDGKFKTFSKIKANDGRANSLHYKLSFSVLHFIAQLDNKMPVVRDNLGNKVAFDVARFELIESHVDDITVHKVAINYETEVLTMVELMGEYLLLSAGNVDGMEPVSTFMVRMQPNLAVSSYQEIPLQQMI